MTLYFWCDPGRHRIKTKEKATSGAISIYCQQHKFKMRLLGTGHDGRNEWLKLEKQKKKLA